MNIYFLFTLFLLLLIVVWVVWRVASRRRSIPCPAWLSWMVDNPFSLRRTAATMQHLELEPGQRVLDGGCGPGRLSIPIAKALGPEGSVLAVDIQSEMIERVRRKAASASLDNIVFLKAGLGDGRLPEGWFDRAVLSTVLGEIPDRLSAMREIYTALKPGGFLLVNEVIGDPHYQSLAKVEALAQEAGYHPSTVHDSRMGFSIKLEKPMNQIRT